MISTINKTPNRYVTVKQCPSNYPVFSENSIRWLIFNEHSNGFSRCVKRIGRKILIDTFELENWISEQGGK